MENMKLALEAEYIRRVQKMFTVFKTLLLNTN